MLKVFRKSWDVTKSPGMLHLRRCHIVSAICQLSYLSIQVTPAGMRDIVLTRGFRFWSFSPARVSRLNSTVPDH